MYDESCLPRIGSNIKILRNSCRLNQYQFAEHIGISQTHLSNIEHNNVQVSLKLLVRSANVFGCNLETLLDKKAASEWVEVQYREEKVQDDSGECGSENAAAAAETQELYSLEEMHLLLKVLQKKTI